MKKDIHPNYANITVTCSCGNSFHTRSTAGDLKLEACSECHPFYTGKQKTNIVGRVMRFNEKYGKIKPQLKQDA